MQSATNTFALSTELINHTATFKINRTYCQLSPVSMAGAYLPFLFDEKKY